MSRSKRGRYKVAKLGLKRRLLPYVPDFCWQSSFEILIMFELVEEDVLPMSVMKAIWDLKYDGALLTRISKYSMRGPGGITYLYRRNPEFQRFN